MLLSSDVILRVCDGRLEPNVDRLFGRDEARLETAE